MNARAEAAGALRPAILPPWLRGLLPRWLKPAVRRAICAGVDLLDRARGERDALMPPAYLRVRVGCFLSYLRRDRYRRVGTEFATHLQSMAGLREDSAMLDIGCGCGQVASALAPLLDTRGRYEGFDPDAEAIAWCAASITPRLPRFHFQAADLGNTLYNPRGRLRAEDFRFPYEDAAFDVILLKSIFTHMAPAPMQHYLHEIRRLLRPGGRCMVTGYFPDAAARERIAAGRAAYAFEECGDGLRIVDARTPDYVTAHDEEALRAAVQRAGLLFAEPIHPGAWSGAERFTSYQDIVLLTRHGEAANDA
jgi:SAM-dependent methyltransferase